MRAWSVISTGAPLKRLSAILLGIIVSACSAPKVGGGRSEVALHLQEESLVEQMRQQMVSAPAPPATDQGWVDAGRAAYRGFIPLAGDAVEVASVNDRTIEGPSSDLPIRVYDGSSAEDAPLIVYLHGGGFTAGGLDTHDIPLRVLAARASAVVVAVDYRLAPEHPFPAAIEDAHATLMWAYTNARQLGADPNRLVVMGDSAGGNLAASACLLSTERCDPPVALQVLIYPNTDLRLDRSYASIDRFDGIVISRTDIDRNITLYLPNPTDRSSELASPVLSTRLAELPRTLLITAGADPLRDEGELYAARLRQAGVRVTHTRYPGTIHGFFQMAGALDSGEEVMGEVAAAVLQTAGGTQ